MIITVIPSDQGTGAKAGSPAENVTQEAPPPPADAP
jgi:hypothetical protein